MKQNKIMKKLKTKACRRVPPSEKGVKYGPYKHSVVSYVPLKKVQDCPPTPYHLTLQFFFNSPRFCQIFPAYSPISSPYSPKSSNYKNLNANSNKNKHK